VAASLVSCFSIKKLYSYGNASFFGSTKASEIPALPHLLFNLLASVNQLKQADTASEPVSSVPGSIIWTKAAPLTELPGSNFSSNG
jgi:hypothetical protein